MVDASEAIVDACGDGPSDAAKEKFRNQAALLIAVLAAILAFCSLGGDNATDEMMFNNIRASDTWAFYQAKNVRQNMYKVAADDLARDLGQVDPASPRGQALAADLRKYRQTVDRYESEPDAKAPGDPTAGEGKAQLRAKALAYEKARDVAIARDGAFDLSEMVLQLAIVLGSVAILALSRPLLLASAGLGVLGAILTINGFFLLFPLPF